MGDHSARSTAFAVATVLVVLGSASVYVPNAGAGTLNLGTFDANTEGWSLGPGWDRDCSLSSCALRVEPPCCGQYVFARRTVDFPLTSATTVAFSYASDCTCGDTDSALEIILDNGAGVYLHTSAPDGNHGLQLQVHGGETRTFFQWGATHTFHRAAVVLDPQGGVVYAQAWNADGSGPYTSAALAYPAGATGIAWVGAYGVFWGNVYTRWWYDDFAIIGAAEAPGAPRDLRAESGPMSREITLTWAAPESDGGIPLLGYRITRTPAAGGASVTREVADVRSYTDTGLETGASYIYEVAAFNAAGAGPAAAATASTFPPPGAPRNLTALPAAEPGSVHLRWESPQEAGGPEALSYAIYRSTAAGDPGERVGTTSALEFTDSRVPSGSYAYTTRAFRAGEGGPASGEAYATVASLYSSAPRNLRAAAGSVPGEIHLLWNPPEASPDRVNGYEIIDIHPDGSVTTVRVGNVLQHTLRFRTEGLHGFFVRAVTDAGPSRESNSASAVSDGPIVIGFGDSVAAGYGLGPAQGFPNNEMSFPDQLASMLGGFAYNFAVTGACSATAGETFSHWRTYEGCDHSVLNDQLPRARNLDVLRGGRPSVVVLNVGANDIGFSGCLADFFAGSYAVFVDNPCDRRELARSLEAYQANMGWVVADVRDLYGANTPIVINRYYNPFPNTDDPTIGWHACGIFGSRAAKHINTQSQFADNATWEFALLTAQSEGHELALRIIDELNRAVDAVAARHGLLVATPSFHGHDMCRAERDGDAADPTDTWVLGPSVRMAGTPWSLTGSGAITERTFGPAPHACAAPSGEPSASVTYTFVDGAVRVDFDPNCMPHPTVDGQEAIARTIRDVLVQDVPLTR